MSTTKKHFWQRFSLGLGSILVLLGLGVFALHAAHALTVENVGGTLGLGSADLKQTIINIIKWVLGILGLVAVIIMLYGGFLWLTSRGNEQQIDKAKRTLINGVIGLVIVLLAWAIVLFVQRFITNATGGSAQAAECLLSKPGDWPQCTLCNGDGDGDPTNDIGTLVPDPSQACTGNLPKPYYAIEEHPVIGAQDVKLCESVYAGFGGLAAGHNNVDPTSVLAVAQCTGGNCTSSTPITGTMSLFNNVAEFDHVADFSQNSTYTVDVTKVRSTILQDGIYATTPVPPNEWTFRTGTLSDKNPPTVVSTTPSQAEQLDCLSPVIEVNFSEDMLPKSIFNAANLRLTSTDPNAKIPGIAHIDTPSFNVLQVTLDGPLSKSTTYTVTLSADKGADFSKGYRDSCGNALNCGNAAFGTCDSSDGTTEGDPADNFKWQFSTKDTETLDCTPSITSVDTVGYYGNASTQKLVTITGTNFGSNPTVLFNGNVPATKVAGGGSLCFADSNLPNQLTSPQCLQTTPTPDTKITTIVPAGPMTYSPTGAQSGSVVVQLGAKFSAPSQTSVQVGSPHIDWISPNQGKAGRFVTISGSNFGLGGKVRFRNFSGSVSVDAASPICASNPWSNTQILTQVPTGFNIGDVAYVQVCGQNDPSCSVPNVSNLSRFDYKDVDGPNLCSINPTSSNDGAAKLTATGRGFGTATGNIKIFYGSFAGDVVEPPALTDTQLDAQPRGGALGNGTYQFTVQVGGNNSNPLAYSIPKDPAPEVVRDASCSTTDANRMAPNPTPDTTGICRNAGVTARFTTSMYAGTTGGTLDPALFTVQACGTGSTFTAANCGVSLAGTRTAGNYQSLLTNDLVRFVPTTEFSAGTWYQVTLHQGIHGTNATGPVLAQDFTWHFQTRTDPADCAVENVSVNPPHPTALQTGSSATFVASGFTNSCTYIASGYAFSTPWGTTNAGLTGAPTSSSTNGHANDTALITIPYGQLDGTAYLTATTGSVSGKAQVDVVRNYCEKASDCTQQWNADHTFQCADSTCNLATHKCTPVVHDINGLTNASGPAGDIVQVNGCFFGNSKGSGDVVFTSGRTPANGSFAVCSLAGWTDSSIRVQAEPDNATAGTTWTTTVRTYDALQSTNAIPITYTIANQCSTPTNGITDLPASGKKPIVCSITPGSAREGATISYAGNNFAPTPNGQAYFTSSSQPAQNFPLAGTGTSLTAQTATTKVPAGAGMPSTPTGSLAQTTIGVTSQSGGTCLASPVNFAVSCSQNNECGSGCCPGYICQATAACTNGLVQSFTPPSGALSCRNSIFSVTFAKDINANSVTSSTLKLELGASIIPSDISLSGRTATLVPKQSLANGAYTLLVSGTAAGVQATDGTFMGADFPIAYTVGAGATICQIANVEIHDAFTGFKLTSDQFTCSGDTCLNDRALGTVAGNQHQYIAQAYDANGAGPLALASTTWKEGDAGGTPGNANTFSVCSGGAPCTGQTNQQNFWATALNSASGTESLTVNVTGTASSGSGATSMSISDFMCANPWPASGAPFTDPVGSSFSHGFTIQICRDGNPQFTLGNSIFGQQNVGLLQKEYFFFAQDTKNGNANTGDAIGVRIIDNQADLSPLRWYQKTFGKDPSGSTLEVDGYPAIREGRTVYIAADYAANDGSLSFPYIYVFSYTDKASAATVAMFESLLQNLHFNTSISNVALRHDDLRTDVKRVFAYEEIIYALDAYQHAHSGNFPTLESGSYLKNYSMTSWPSWQQNLGAQLGITVPKDPVNQWNTTWAGSPCTGSAIDPVTCWDATAKTMHFPNANSNVEPPYSNGIIYHYLTGADGKPETQLYGTGSTYFWAHSSVFTNAFKNGYPIVIPSRTTNVCPVGQSQCYGFNVLLDSNDNSGKAYTTIVDARVKKDAAAPTVSIASPATGSTLSSTVEVIATASDTATGNSGIGTVNFSVKNASGSQLITGVVSDVSADGNYHWTFNSRQFANGTIAGGTGITLSVTATDKASNTSNAVPASFNVQNAPGDALPPVLTLVSPNANGTASGATYAVSARASDSQPNDSGVAKVEFYLGTSKVGESDCLATCPPVFSASVDTTVFPDGSYTYSAVAYDNFGNTSIKQLTLQVSNGVSGGSAPTVSIAFPTAPGAISGTSASVVANVTDNSGKGIDYVSFAVDGQTRATLTNGPYSFTWLFKDAQGVAYANASTHTVVVTAYDRSGKSTSSLPANYTYGAAASADTQAPVLSNITPNDGDTLSLTSNISALVVDNVGVQSIQLFIDGTNVPLTGCSIGVKSCNLSYDWNTLPELAGGHSIAMSATDTSNNVTTVALNVSVSNQVIMAFTLPGNNATVQDTGTCSNNGRSCTDSTQCTDTTMRCTDAPSRVCDVATDCNVQSCLISGKLCSMTAVPSGCDPGDTCANRTGKCQGGSTGTCNQANRITIAVSKTCRTDQLLSSVKLYIDNLSASSLFATMTNCTNGQCAYTWSSKTTTSDGPHTLYAIGTAINGTTTCMGGAKVNVVVNNNLTDTTPPTITSFSFVTPPWNTGSPVTIKSGGMVTVQAQDNAGGSGLSAIGITVKDSSNAVTATSTCSTPTCQLNWNPTADGTYQVTATATDNDGNVATLTQVANVDSTPPTISWSAPADGTTVTAVPSIFTATASDPLASGFASGIQNVIFYQNGAPLSPNASSSGSTYTGSFSSLSIGTASFFARAQDQAGNTTDSPTVQLNIQTQDLPPSVNITSPNVDGFYYRGTLGISASAIDATGVHDVQFYLDGTSSTNALGNLITATPPYTASSFSTTLDTTTLGNGTLHTLNARACDVGGNCAISPVRTFLVNNDGGTNCGTTICNGTTPQCCSGVCRASGYSCIVSGA